MNHASPLVEMRDVERTPTPALSMSCTILRGGPSILAASGALNSLRTCTGQQDEVTTDPEWFVGINIASGKIPWVVELFGGHQLVAAMLFAERCIFSLPTGYLKSDGGFGEESLICPANMRATYLPALLEGLFARRSVLIAHVAQDAHAETAFVTLANDSKIGLEWKRRPSHYLLSLHASMEETLAPYGVRTRRNLRYYLRKCRSEGCRFLSELNGDERLEAVMSLSDSATHRLPVVSVMRREATMQAISGSFALGIRAADGSWASYLTGWRRGQRSFVYVQMNRVTEKNSSFGTAIRAFLMEEEIARGTREIIFVGGTSRVFMACCDEALCVDLIARRRGRRTKVLSFLMNRLLGPGHPLRSR